jgi:sugar/nucleoside kinase (ribokinase family)
VCIPDAHTTTFENVLTPQGRVQTVHHPAASITFESVPEPWQNASIIHIGPVVHELDPQEVSKFSGALLGLTPQGWMRTWDAAGHVRPQAWESAGLLGSQAGAVVISREDVGGDEEVIETLAHQTRVLAVTEGPAGSVLYWNGDRRRFRAPEVVEVDGTGAGDIFATALFFRLFTTRDPWEAARFATRLASYSVSRPGLDGIPRRDEIAESMAEILS